LVTKVIKLQV